MKRIWILVVGLVALVVVGLLVKVRKPTLDPKQAVANATFLMQQGLVDEARHVLDAVLESEPDDAPALLYRGELARGGGDLPSAIEYWARIGDDPPDVSSTARYLESNVLIELGRAREADHKLRRAIELRPTYLPPKDLLLTLYVLQRRTRATHELLDNISEQRPLTLDEMVLQTAAGQQIIPAADAIPQLKAFVTADPQDVASGLALARYHIEEDKADDAIRSLRPFLERFPDDARIRAMSAEARRESGEVGVSELDQVSPDDTSPAEVWRAVGQAALDHGDLARAAECFGQAAQRNPDDYTTRYHLGLLLQRRGDEATGKQYIEQAVLIDRLQRQARIVSRLDRQRAELIIPVLIEVGELHLQLGRFERALQWYASVLQMNSNDPAALAGAQRARQGMQSQPAFGPAIDPETVASGEDASPSTTVVSIPRPVTRPTSPSARVSPLRLRDVRAEAGIDHQYFNGDTGFKYLIESMGGGVAVLDYDCDGWPDFYFPQGSSLPYDADDQTHLDRVVRNLGDGTFTDETAHATLHENRYSQGCSVGDWDNDGFPDLIVANYGQNTIYRNNGDGTFTDVTRQAGLLEEKMSSSVAFADLDRDGDLDLYVVNYVDSLKVCRNPQGEISACDPANFNAEQDSLYLNRGDGTFADISASGGIVAPDGKGLGVVVSDLDDDGWPDIYVANDGTPNFLFRNTSVDRVGSGQDSTDMSFDEQGLISGAAVSGAGSSEAGMGIACADLNADQRLDLFVTNFYLETNTLYLNQGSALFTDATMATGLAGPSKSMLGFGTQAIDLDLDGRLELFVANGHIDNREHAREPWKMTAQLFASDGERVYSDVSRQGGAYFGEKHLGRGVARLDWNRDGRPDLAVVHQDAPAALLSNETSTIGHVAVLELHGVESNRDAIGARILLTAGGATQAMEICGGDGFYCSNERRQFVGLGEATDIETLEIQWPSGKIDRWHGVPSDRVLIVLEGRAPVAEPLVGDS